MYQKGEYVIYGIQGVCCVIGTEIQRINRVRTEYLILEPLEKAESRFFVPTANPSAMGKLKPLLSPDELKQVLSSEAIRQDCWIPEENHRKQHYRELSSGCDRIRLLNMLSTLYRQREEQLTAGRKFHQCDENFLRDAERLLGMEVSMVLGMTPEEARNYLRQHLT